MVSAIPQEFLIATRVPGSVSKAKQTLPSEMYVVTGMTEEHGESTEEVERDCGGGQRTSDCTVFNHV